MGGRHCKFGRLAGCGPCMLVGRNGCWCETCFLGDLDYGIEGGGREFGFIIIRCMIAWSSFFIIGIVHK